MPTRGKPMILNPDIMATTTSLLKPTLDISPIKPNMSAIISRHSFINHLTIHDMIYINPNAAVTSPANEAIPTRIKNLTLWFDSDNAVTRMSSAAIPVQAVIRPAIPCPTLFNNSPRSPNVLSIAFFSLPAASFPAAASYRTSSCHPCPANQACRNGTSCPSCLSCPSSWDDPHSRPQASSSSSSCAFR